MRYSICIIDDHIPAAKADGIMDDRKMLSPRDLKILLDGYQWDESGVKELVNVLITDQDKWSICGFTQPDFYLNHIKEELYRPEIIIYDWNTGAPAFDKLKEILELSFAVVNIYSAKHYENDINAQVIQSPLLEQYKSRLSALFKDDENAAQELLDKAQKMWDENFSFKFGRLLRIETLNSIDKVLVELGKMPIDKVLLLLGQQDKPESFEKDFKDMIVEKIKCHLVESAKLLKLFGDKYERSVRSFIEFFTHRMKNDLSSRKIEMNPPGATAVVVDDDVAKKLWSYRLYYGPCDNFVRRGDVICKRDSFPDCEEVFLVLTADCDLVQFWHKNFGFLNLVRLQSVSKCTRLKDKLTITRSLGDIRFETESLTSKLGKFPEGPVILPFVPVKTELINYILFPKEIQSEGIVIPAIYDTINKKKGARLEYEHLGLYERICSISEPFLTPLVEHVLSTIAGYGTPDYPEMIKTIIENSKDQLR